ncbi:MAG: SDR family NAD(P)-dependent oxidoreductase, partial [Pseudonocardiaceae bacterium]
ERGARALKSVEASSTGHPPELVALDLADLASVHDAAAHVRAATGDRLDVLVNNAGVMATPKGRTKNGFETQFGTNHLGHAALTWLLMPALVGAAHSGSASRVVTVSSLAAGQGTIDTDDPHFENRPYNPARGYGQAKLANQVFALELDRRLRAAGQNVISVAAHPGYTATDLSGNMAGSYRNPIVVNVLKFGAWVGDTVIAQSVAIGALPQLYAATSAEVEGGQYIGPDGYRQFRGGPTRVTPLRPARDPELGAKLWALTAKLTGVTPDPA